MNNLKIGIFGGTFDPPHIGHLAITKKALDQLKLNKVLWVVTQTPPHKIGKVISPVEIRVEMVKGVIKNYPEFEISRIDIDRPGPHYTVDTVSLIQKMYPEAELYYLMGGDSLRDLPKWARPQELISKVKLAVLKRPGSEFDLHELEKIIPGITQKIVFIHHPLKYDIASHIIREGIEQGKNMNDKLSKGVVEIIQREKLYQ